MMRPYVHSISGAESQNRTGDTAIFSRVLYQLSYLGEGQDSIRNAFGSSICRLGLPAKLLA